VLAWNFIVRWEKEEKVGAKDKGKFSHRGRPRDSKENLSDGDNDAKRTVEAKSKREKESYAREVIKCESPGKRQILNRFLSKNKFYVGLANYKKQNLGKKF